MQPGPLTLFARLGRDAGRCERSSSPNVTSRGLRLLLSFPLLLASTHFLVACTPQDPIEQALALVEEGQLEAASDVLKLAVEAHPEEARLQKGF